MKIKIINHEKTTELECGNSETLLDAMKRRQMYVPAYCSGRGSCGKCKIQLLEGYLDVTDADKKAFDKEQLEAGMRLSCQARPVQDCTIRLCTEDEENFDILTSPTVSGEHKAGASESSGSYGIAVDIGTTTIAMELLDMETGHSLGKDSRINHQRAYGADVISRIQASVDGLGAQLRVSVCRDLLDGMMVLLLQSGASLEQIKKIVIAANTTMCHLLMGYACDTLGVAPFTPVNIGTIRSNMAAVLEPVLADAPQSFSGTLLEKIELVILPGISTFVGADIVAGLLVCDFSRREDTCMLIDLGTNGEMAIGNKHRRIATSTAAGPAFEGGNISCGTGSVKGAICAVELKDGEMTYQTIGDGAPVGICGTGVLDITAELVKHEIVDETGLLEDDYFDDGVFVAKSASGASISFSQKDVREIQLAKAAVRAGIQVLLKRFGVECEALSTVYLSGGFGFRLDVDKAIAIGLLPEGFRGKIKIAGNSSLAGATACLLDEQCLLSAGELAQSTEEISLGNDADFNEYYMDAMYFENE